MFAQTKKNQIFSKWISLLVNKDVNREAEASSPRQQKKQVSVF